MLCIICYVILCMGNYVWYDNYAMYDISCVYLMLCYGCNVYMCLCNVCMFHLRQKSTCIIAHFR